MTTIDSRTLYLKWDPPFTLNVTQVSPDNISGYVLHITNINTTQSRSQRVNQSEYVFRRQDWPCFLYAFNVSAVNKVGQGNSSELVLGSFHGVDMQENCKSKIFHCHPLDSPFVASIFKSTCSGKLKPKT